MKKRIKLWSFTLVVALLSVACVNDDFNNSGTLEGNQTNGENIKLGMKMKIAFTIENMQKAYENIKNNSTAKQFPGNGQHYRTNNETNNYSGNDYIINTTHYYYKFTPRDSIQYERLVNDSILSVTDIPFEYVIETDGEKYQAADMSNTNFTHYYSVVPIDYNIPSEIEYEVIANLHFTKEDEIDDNASEYDMQKVDFFHDLNTEALKISDNLEEEKENLLYQFVNPNGETETLTWQQAQNRGLNLEQLVINFNEDDYDAPDFFARRSKWNPCGTVTTQEDAVNINVGVWDAKIKVRKWGGG